jgi:AraC-like DNA-binding protein
METRERLGFALMSSLSKSMNPALASIHESVADLQPPQNYFHGLKLADSFSPDNILFFCHHNRQAFQPEGISNTFHHRFVLVMVVRKGGPARIGDLTHLLEEGEGALIFPHQFHHFLDVEAGELEWLFITFELGATAPIESLRDTPRKLDQETLFLIGDMLNNHRRLVRGEVHSVAGISHYLAEILLRMRQLPPIDSTRMNIHATDDQRDVILDRINHFVGSNLHRQLTVADLAKELGYSVSYLRLIFRSRLGFSLGKFMRASRLSKAAALLEDRSLSITYVAKESGFESLTAFSRAFKQTYGVSPKAYSKAITTRG